MGNFEQRVRWPDPDEPVFTERSLTLMRNGGEPIQIQKIRLIVLVNHCLYLVPENGHGLRSGQVLWRNMHLTLRRGGSRGDFATHQFVAYDSLNHARRAAALIEPSYREVEDPELREWLQTLDWMVRTSWTLHEVDEKAQAHYEWVAAQTAGDQSRVRSAHKVAARGRTTQAASIKDSRGRRNPGRIPLIVFAGERELRKRINEIRGIGRRMSWRQVVLEHYIDRLREITRQISRGAQSRVRSPQLFGGERTNGAVRTEADRVLAEATRLRSLVGRPFSRNFARVASDLEEVAEHMRAAADALDGELMAPVISTLNTIYRSVQLLQYHWRLEELLVQTSRVSHTNQEISPSVQLMWRDELSSIHRALVRPDPLTGKSWEDGFKRRVVPRVIAQIHLAEARLMEPVSAGGPNITEMHTHLRDACSPF